MKKSRADRVLKDIGGDIDTLELVVQIAELFFRRSRKKRCLVAKHNLTA